MSNPTPTSTMKTTWNDWLYMITACQTWIKNALLSSLLLLTTTILLVGLWPNRRLAVSISPPPCWPLWHLCSTSSTFCSASHSTGSSSPSIFSAAPSALHCRTAFIETCPVTYSRHRCCASSWRFLLAAILFFSSISHLTRCRSVFSYNFYLCLKYCASFTIESSSAFLSKLLGLSA